MKRARTREAMRRLRMPRGKWYESDLSEMSFVPKGMTKAYKNNRFVVMVFENTPTTGGNAVKVMVQNHFNKPIENHWAEMQRIKNELFGCEVLAIEYYPKQSKLIDDENIYWLWIFPDGEIPVKI